MFVPNVVTTILYSIMIVGGVVALYEGLLYLADKTTGIKN